MTSMTDLPKELFIPNPNRGKDQREVTVPEHERLNVHEEPPELRKIKFQEKISKIRRDFRNYTQDMKQTMKNVGAVSGFTEDRDWTPPGEPIRPETIPQKPSTPFEHAYEEAPQQPDESELNLSQLGKDINEASLGQILIVVADEVIPCKNIQEAEEIVELLLFKEQTNIEAISILEKRKLKLGISIS